MPSWMPPHWAIQSVGTALLLLVGGIGLFQSSSIHSNHQIAGIALVTISLLQVFIGHSIKSLVKARLQLQSWARNYHIFQGFSSLILGWWAVLSGLQLSSFSSTSIIVVGLASLVEITGLILFCGMERWRSRYLRVPKVVVHDAEESSGQSYARMSMSQRLDYDEA